MIKAVFFDWDMTLVDSTVPMKKIYDEFCKKHEITQKYAMKDVLKLDTNGVIKKFHLGKYKRYYILFQYIRLMRKYSKYSRLKGKSLLQFLEAREIPYVIITDNFKKAIKKNFKIHPAFIIDYIQVRGKKNRGIKKALKKLKLQPHEVIYVGDKPKDITQGKMAGVRTVGITTLYSRAELMKHKPFMVISRLDELKKLFK